MIVGCYHLQLICDRQVVKYGRQQECRNTIDIARQHQTQASAMKEARARGWRGGKNGQVTCPGCRAHRETGNTQPRVIG